MLIDTHAHLNFSAYKEDADRVIRRSLDGDIWMINVGSQLTTSKRAVRIAEEYPKGVYAAIGLHPIHAQDDFNYDEYKKLALSDSRRVVAIGEIGLDYKEEYISFKERQKKILIEQMNLAKELNLPIIFHCRKAHEDLIEIVNLKFKARNSKLRGVIHCFTGDRNQAEKYIEKGLYLGFNGIIFKMDLDDVIKKTPLERILIETDCPYLTPPFQKGRNEPAYVKYVAEKIAKIKDLDYKEIAQITTRNAKELFKI